MKDAHQLPKAKLADIQNSPDMRDIDIDRVGVRGIRYPITVREREGGHQSTIGDFTLTVDLPREFKGTHMSRFLEVLNDHQHLTADSIGTILTELRTRLNASAAHLDVTFAFFMPKAAPVTGKVGLMEYTCGFSAVGGLGEDFEMIVQVPVTTLCPCSKEISARGAHNQRGIVTAKLRSSSLVWLEDVIQMVEACASCELFPVLKRPDEKYVTERAYDNPRFVEDMVREVALAFDRDDRIVSYEIEVENHESIHAHNAYASLKRNKLDRAD